MWTYRDKLNVIQKILLWKTISVTFSFMRANPRLWVKFSFFGHPVCDGQFSTSELSSDLQLWVARSFECFRLYIIELQLCVIILSVNCTFFVFLWSRFSVLRVPVDLWLSLLYVYFRERPTVLCVFVCDWQISLFIFLCFSFIISVQNFRFAFSCVCLGRDFQFCKLISVGKFQFSCLSLSVCFKVIP